MGFRPGAAYQHQGQVSRYRSTEATSFVESERHGIQPVTNYRVEPSHLELLLFPVNSISSDVDQMDIVVTAARKTRIAYTSHPQVTFSDNVWAKRSVQNNWSR